MAETEINRLLKPRQTKRLKPAAERDPISASVGEAIPVETSQAQSAESSIASPLTEQSQSGVLQLRTSDGLFWLEYPNQVTYEDANQNDVVFINA